MSSRGRSALGMARQRVRRSRACGGPLLDPPSRSKYPNKFIRLPTTFHTRVNALAENVVNGVKTIMVNEPLRAARARRVEKSAVLRRGPGAATDAPPLSERGMPKPKPLMTKSSVTDHAHEAV